MLAFTLIVMQFYNELQGSIESTY